MALVYIFSTHGGSAYDVVNRNYDRILNYSQQKHSSTSTRTPEKLVNNMQWIDHNILLSRLHYGMGRMFESFSCLKPIDN